MPEQTPTKTTPKVTPDTEPMRRMRPGTECPGQRVRIAGVPRRILR